MDRDIIEEPVMFREKGRDWWYQQFNGWDGNLKAVNLYDEDGVFVCEFDSLEELMYFVKGVKSRVQVAH